MTAILRRLIAATETLRDAVDALSFPSPVAYVYNPLQYAWEPHRQYLEQYGDGRKRVIFLGMNPGPHGMAQTGVPFGEVAAVRDWMGISAKVGHPPREHPKKAVAGFECRRSEPSGRKLWGLFASRFGTAERFFADHFVVNYCPLLFLDDEARNVTPASLPKNVCAPMFAACDAYLRELVECLSPEWLIGVGAFAEERLRTVFPEGSARIGRIPHPSPANPRSHADWDRQAAEALVEQGVW